MMKASREIIICYYLIVVVCAAAARDNKLRWVSDRTHTGSNGGRRTKSSTAIALTEHGRQLQEVSCVFTPHGRAIACTEPPRGGVIVKYSVTCPEGATLVDECLQDQKRICYQFNSSPCIGSFFCASTSRFSLDCGNLFARSNSNCSKTDCTGNCTELRDVPANYNLVEVDNDCLRLGLSSTVNCATGPCIVTTEWTHVLSNGATEIQVTGTRNSENNVFETCQVAVAGQPGSSCPCSVNCPPFTSQISYDCTNLSTDACAAIDCSGNCIPGGSIVPPVALPVQPPIVAPVTPPVQPPVVAPVTPPVQPPIVAPVTPPVQPPIVAPVIPPVQPPIVAPVTPPVQPPIVAPVTPPVQPPIVAPVIPPVQPPIVAPPVQPPIVVPVILPVQPPIVVPVILPVRPPIVVPVILPVRPPIVAPVTPPVRPPVAPVPVMLPTGNGTVCAVWWGLF